jgi:hypothetical protein
VCEGGTQVQAEVIALAIRVGRMMVRIHRLLSRPKASPGTGEDIYFFVALDLEIYLDPWTP